MGADKLYKKHKQELCKICNCTENECKGITICIDKSTICNKGRVSNDNKK